MKFMVKMLHWHIIAAEFVVMSDHSGLVLLCALFYRYLVLIIRLLPRYNTRHVALKIAYLGQDYHGFAVQEDTDKTIENVLFDALTKTRLIEKR